MENVNLKDVLIGRLSDIFSDVKLANSLVDEGKEVHASRRLQGVRTKILALMENARKHFPDILIPIQEVQEVQEEVQEDVAPKVAETE